MVRVSPVTHLLLMRSRWIITQMSIFALNITPYITSSIIMQLLTTAIPKLEELQRVGEEGRKITEITRYLTVVCQFSSLSPCPLDLEGKA
ncbi:MAG: hypothetical protein ACLRWH_11385 [Emergencia sp.]